MKEAVQPTCPRCTFNYFSMETIYGPNTEVAWIVFCASCGHVVGVVAREVEVTNKVDVEVTNTVDVSVS